MMGVCILFDSERIDVRDDGGGDVALHMYKYIQFVQLSRVDVFTAILVSSYLRTVQA